MSDTSPRPGPRPAAGRTEGLRFGYGTNGLTDLRLDDALGLLADLGYAGVGLTLDHMHLDPLAPDLADRTRHVARGLDRLGLTATIETGARYVLDPRRKHGPSLLDPDPDHRAERVRLLIRAVQVAADLNAHAVHCFSGITPADTSDDTAWKRLADALGPVLDAAATAGVPLAVEPEPGHLLSHSPTSTSSAPNSAPPSPAFSASPSTSVTASASNRSLPPTAYAPPLPGCTTSRSRTCAAASTSTCPSVPGRSTSRPSSKPWQPPATEA
ncbi:hypothetical protein SALBM135S_02197 [Streptomyces alboniger]